MKISNSFRFARLFPCQEALAWTELLAQRFPQVLLDPGVLYVDEGDVLA
jgi:hypothetical protein